MKNKEKTNQTGPVEIAPGVYWIGHRFNAEGIECNPYLIIQDGKGVLIDPGSVIDFTYVFENLTSLISVEDIALIIAHHQDPDICGGIPEFYAHGVTAPIAMHWRTSVLVRYYGIQNENYLVSDNNWCWSFPGGRTLRFLPAPYCHFAGAIMTYDEQTKILFSSDLFGALSPSPDLFAGSDYIDQMKAFHAHYMPSHEILSPVMRSLMPLDIQCIAPQHGQIITNDIEKHIRILESLECGTYAVKMEEPYNKDLVTTSTEKSSGDTLFRKAIARIHKENAGESAFFYFALNNLETVNNTISRKAGDEMLNALSYIVSNTLSDEEDWDQYSLDSPVIACVALDTDRESVGNVVEKILHTAKTTEFTIEPLIISTAVVYSSELATIPEKDAVGEAVRLLTARLIHAKQNPAGGFCDSLGEKDTQRHLRKSILLIEPDNSYVQYLEPFLVRRGYTLTTVSNGSMIKEILSENMPDLIISEAMTPQMSGFEIFDILKMSGKGATVPFILVSRRKDETYLQIAAEKGIVHFLKKPFYKTELLGLVDNLLRRSQ